MFQICWPARLFRCFRNAWHVWVFSGNSDTLSAQMFLTWARLQAAPIVSPGKHIVFTGDVGGAAGL